MGNSPGSALTRECRSRETSDGAMPQASTQTIVQRSSECGDSGAAAGGDGRKLEASGRQVLHVQSPGCQCCGKRQVLSAITLECGMFLRGQVPRSILVLVYARRDINTGRAETWKERVHWQGRLTSRLESCTRRRGVTSPRRGDRVPASVVNRT
ncbi:hypothetical protein BD413DRAFT_38067 [Trametes elegans]|nr:hypothetical protein BD413DRAFT_38067 [Trametes elegans]